MPLWYLASGRRRPFLSEYRVSKGESWKRDWTGGSSGAASSCIVVVRAEGGVSLVAACSGMASFGVACRSPRIRSHPSGSENRRLDMQREGEHYRPESADRSIPA